VQVLKGVTLSVKRQQVVGFIGASGSGKSTLLRCINMLETPSSGDIFLEGQPIGFRDAGTKRVPLSQRELSLQRRQMSMVFQQFNLWPHKTALENVIEGLIVAQSMPLARARERGVRLLEKVGLGEKLDAYPSRLSGGQQQRVGIARALALDPKILLLDEPTSALDPELVADVLEVIRSLAQEGLTMIIVTHEMSFAHQVCDHIVFLDKGVVCDSGPPDHIFGATAEPRTRAFVNRYLQQTK
ncbi:MAG TPA: amino acid ABC transporter ATP-binding protein, partial [Burkholderiaceae bacterium]|nr:amino acid ABC transporter ATP-binding protein [Burkholderiaceae bacterium]